MYSVRKQPIVFNPIRSYDRPVLLENPYAGTWYSSDPEKLKKEMSAWLDGAEENPEKPAALIVPHAGYCYSGAAAMKAYSKIRGHHYSRVIVLAPSHRAYLKNQFCIPSADGTATPFGTVLFERAALERLAGIPGAVTDDRIQQNEHSGQLQYPFLQFLLKEDFRVIPLILGSFDPEHKTLLQNALKEFLTPETLVVISSDFVHYGASYDYLPFTDHPEENLKNLNFGAFELIRKYDTAGFDAYIERTGATICGAVPISLMLELLPEKEPVLTHYSTSAEVSGSFRECVCYLSCVFYGPWPEPENSLTENDKRTLLKLARSVIEKNFDPSVELPDIEGLGEFAYQKAGAFVTLKEGNNLRGCIGEILPYRPLVKAIRERALDAAFHDPRFYPLRQQELNLIRIEISALTPPHSVSSWQEIELGRHGIVLTKNGCSAVFLPQVPGEQGWDLPETLSFLSRKAGLAEDAWKSGASFDVFEAIVFGEEDFQ